MKVKTLVFFLLPILIIVGMIVIRMKTNESPDIDMVQARKMLAQAQLASSPRFAKDDFLEASGYYDSAMVEWKNQNNIFILFRNYRKTIELAEKSSISSENAIKKARKNISNTEDILEIHIERLGKKIKNFEEIFGSFPINKSHRNEMVKCKLLYSEGVHAYKNKNYGISQSKLDSAERTINNVFGHYQEKLIDYFGEYPKWNEMVEKTINHSRKNKANVIIIDKMARELSIYKNGEIFKQFSIELGINWIGDKQQQGDKTTPEGLYKIIDRKQNGQTGYYKAFLLDYPNEDDKKRFSLNKKNGIINQNAKIGNLIEIHGNGGKGIDWTDGCIALNDADMDEIFKFCTIGTKVTIVGSTRSLNELSFSLK